MWTCSCTLYMQAVTKQVCWNQHIQLQNIIVHTCVTHIIVISRLHQNLNERLSHKIVVTTAFGGSRGTCIFNVKSWVKGMRVFRRVYIAAAPLQHFL